MVHVNVEHGSWAEVIDPLVDVMEERGWTEGLETIEGVHPAAIGGALARYFSYDACILLNRRYVGDHPVRIILHEVGHHLHYRRELGVPPDECSREQWDEYCSNYFQTEKGVEYVAWEFARYHEGNLGDEWDPDVYEELGGPRLTNPLIETLK